MKYLFRGLWQVLKGLINGVPTITHTAQGEDELRTLAVGKEKGTLDNVGVDLKASIEALGIVLAPQPAPPCLSAG